MISRIVGDELQLNENIHNSTIVTTLEWNLQELRLYKFYDYKSYDSSRVLTIQEFRFLQALQLIECCNLSIVTNFL